MMEGTPADYALIANNLPFGFSDALIRYIPTITTADQSGQIALGLMAFIPLLAVSWAFGLAWNWRRWLVTSAIFHIIFAFFFTTIFTNMVGLATGMVYSLGYWLEQQGVRRGSQPQYYYLLVIMPFYEFLPIIGSSLAMFAGLNVFWGWRKQDNSVRIELKRREHQAVLDEAQADNDDAEADIVSEIEQHAESDDYLSAQDIDRLMSRRSAQKVANNPLFWGFLLVSIFGALPLSQPDSIGYSHR